MANVKISQLPLATSPLDSAVEMPVVQGGVTKRAGMTTIGFLQSGTSAVLRTAQDKMRENISVKDFGAIGNGVADDTAAIQATINAAASQGLGASVYFPTGQYRITAALTITNTKVTLIGEGIDSSIIRQVTASADGVFFNYPISFGLPTGGGVRDLTIEAGAGFSSNAFYGIGSSGTGLRVLNASDNFAVENLSVNNFNRGVAVLHCYNTRWSNYRILYANTALELDLDGTNIGASNTFTAAKISNLGFAGTVATSIGIRIRASGGEFFSFTDITSFGRGIVIDPATGSQQVLYLEFQSVRSDTTTSYGIELDGTAKNVWSIRFDNCWSAFCGSDGVRMTGANVDGIRWVGGTIRENVGNGVLLENSVKNIDFLDAEITGNSRTVSGTNHGVKIQPNVNLWSVQNCRIGNYATGAATQQDGINIAAGTSQNFEITNNTLIGNLGQPIAIGTSSLNYVISGNLPTQTKDMNVSNSRVFTSSTPATVAAGATVYLGPNGLANPFSADSVWIAGRIGIVRECYSAVTAAPGAGQSFTYTLFKNGSATAMTWTISGAGAFSGNTSSNNVTVQPDDFLDIRLVTSAGAAAAKHRYFLTVE
jgi:hypothetical protein